jgi:hypothetical protein
VSKQDKPTRRHVQVTFPEEVYASLEQVAAATDRDGVAGLLRHLGHSVHRAYIGTHDPKAQKAIGEAFQSQAPLDQ